MKNNLGPAPASLAYCIGSAPAGMPVVQWQGTSLRTADQLLAAAVGEPPATAVDQARAPLLDALAAGPRPEEEVRGRAAATGIGLVILRRAKQALGVRSERRTTPGGDNLTGRWFWSLPPEAVPEAGAAP
jgi:hypothetical protein